MLWLIVHLSALAGFKHRLSVFFNWTIALLGAGRAERVITLQQVFGRHAMAAGQRRSGRSGGAPETEIRALETRSATVLAEPTQR